MRWDEFIKACPELGQLARERFMRDELVLLGTIRADGRPRISPCEPDMVEGRLLLGMMWQSPKAKDLLRDARLTVHSVPSDRMNAAGDVKLSALRSLRQKGSSSRTPLRRHRRRLGSASTLDGHRPHPPPGGQYGHPNTAVPPVIRYNGDFSAASAPVPIGTGAAVVL